MGLETLFLAGLAVSAGSQIIGGIAAKNQGEFEADVANQNAKIAQQQAAAEAARVHRNNLRRLGSSANAMAASGITINEGSALEVLGDQAAVGEVDRQLILFGGDARATQFKSDATAASNRGDNALITGFGSAGGTLLTGAAGFQQTFGGKTKTTGG